MSSPAIHSTTRGTMSAGCQWADLRNLKGAELEVHYVETLRSLGTRTGSAAGES